MVLFVSLGEEDRILPASYFSSSVPTKSSAYMQLHEEQEQKQPVHWVF
jgi:hypothetical protein